MSRPSPDDASQVSQLRVALRTGVAWTRTNDVDRPFSAIVNGETWALRLGDFPAEPLYTLLVNGAEVGSFDTWPVAWTRPTD